MLKSPCSKSGVRWDEYAAIAQKNFERQSIESIHLKTVTKGMALTSNCMDPIQNSNVMCKLLHVSDGHTLQEGDISGQNGRGDPRVAAHSEAAPQEDQQRWWVNDKREVGARPDEAGIWGLDAELWGFGDRELPELAVVQFKFGEHQRCAGSCPRHRLTGRGIITAWNACKYCRGWIDGSALAPSLSVFC